MANIYLRLLVALATLGSAGSAIGQDEVGPRNYDLRYEVWLATTSWPALGDIQPVMSGSFDSAGFGIGGAIHTRFREYENSELLIGFDGWFAGTDSNIAGPVDTLYMRHMYIGGSLKWLIGEARVFSLDTGVGYHFADLVQIDSDFYGLAEFQSWEKFRPGAFVGASWDFGRRRPEKRMGMFLSMKVNFADFGRVYDEDILFAPLLGPNAGSLGGPIYMLQFGVAGR